MTDTLINLTFVLAALILAAVLYLVTRPKRPTAEFDGGFSHENDLRVTRVRSPYVISKGE